MPRCSTLLVFFVLSSLHAQDDTATASPPAAEAGPPDTQSGSLEAGSPETGTPKTEAESSPPAHDLREDLIAELPWRSIGPANMGGRITDIAVHPDGMRKAWYVATAGGGVWKSENAGTTWTPLFQDQAGSSIGDIALAPSAPNTLWVGTGEENGRNSVSWGDGVYKSVDAGKTFTHMGLRESFQIGHIEVHPHDPDIVFVGALGRLWSDCDNRGVYRTMDGGTTWEQVLFVDAKTGCIDVRLDPEDPNVVFACMYERQRDAFDGNDPAVRFGEKAGLFKSRDGGSTWQRITDGLPDCKWGRSGLTIHRDNPGILYATIETEKSGWFSGQDQKDPNVPDGDALMGVQGQPHKDGTGIVVQSVTDGGAAAKAGLLEGDLLLSLGDVEIKTRDGFTRTIRSKNAGDEVTVRYRRGDDDAILETQLTYGKRRVRRGPANGPFGTRLGGQQANKQDEQGPDALQTGGTFRSDDHGESWTRVNSLTDRPFYYSVIAVHPTEPQHVYSCGVPFYASSDGGKTFEDVHRRIHVDFHAIALDPEDPDHVLVGCDGGLYESHDRCATWRHIDNLVIGQFYHADVDQAVPYNVYGGMQDNGTWGGPSQTRFRDGIRREDWVTIAGGDGFRARIDPEDPAVVFATSQNGGVLRANVQRAASRGVNKPDDTRWNWDTPFFLSPHNPRILYLAGSRVCRSLNRGVTTTVISGDLELGLTDRGTATAFVESPRRAGIFYVGTDDGALWRSKDDGRTWDEIHANFLDAGLLNAEEGHDGGEAGPRYVSFIEPSHYKDGRVYVTLEGHRSDDLQPHVLMSDDFGDTWSRLDVGDHFPRSPCHVIRELPARGNGSDPGNPDVLIVGTEAGCTASTDRGQSWAPLGRGLPTTPVRDLVIHKRDTDLIAATHGRGIYILDIDPLMQLRAEKASNPDEADSEPPVAESPVAEPSYRLFRPEPAYLWSMQRRSGQGGHARWNAKNPAFGIAIHLWLREAPGKDQRLSILDVDGDTIRDLKIEDRAGLHRIVWDTRRGAQPRKGETPEKARLRAAGRVQAGTYAVRFAPTDNTKPVNTAATAKPDAATESGAGPDGAPEATVKTEAPPVPKAPATPTTRPLRLLPDPGPPARPVRASPQPLPGTDSTLESAAHSGSAQHGEVH